MNTGSACTSTQRLFATVMSKAAASQHRHPRSRRTNVCSNDSGSDRDRPIRLLRVVSGLVAQPAGPSPGNLP
jgi:hypothetical protein